MSNLIFEMKKIVEDSKNKNLPNLLIRNQLKEYLHYFVLNFIYNSKYKEMIFYGGSALRILYGLPRMSEDIDFEADKNLDFAELQKDLKEYFKSDLQLRDNFSVVKTKNINRIFLKLPIMYEIGLSNHADETLNVKIEAKPETEEYFKNLKTEITPKAEYGMSFLVKHYDLPTLFASKLIAVLDRPEKGFLSGKKEDRISFKGRDFYDLIWYMEKEIIPDKNMLELRGNKDSVDKIFDKIEDFISKNNIEKGLKRDLSSLFESQEFVENFSKNFINIFRSLRKRY